jgi:hypothetical protein
MENFLRHWWEQFRENLEADELFSTFPCLFMGAIKIIENNAISDHILTTCLFCPVSKLNRSKNF